MAMTLADSIAITGKEVYEYLDRQAEVPLVDTSCRQGDVFVLRVTTKPASKPLPKEGVAVASGRGGHHHTLHGNGLFDFAPNRNESSLVVGKLTVPDNTDVLLSHPEHGNFLIAPGTYEVRQQREYAGLWRAVTD